MPPAELFDRIAAWPLAEGAMVLAGFAWGAVFGSFINVVVHRLPRGESLAATPSRCPACAAAIRPRDNVPVLSWLCLRGRCRDCGAAIPATYVLVEAGCGALVMLLTAAALAGGGSWTAATPGFRGSGADRLLDGDWPLLVQLALRAAAVLTVAAWSLVDGAGGRLNRTSLALPLALAMTVVAAVPSAGPPPAWVIPANGLPAGPHSGATAATVAGAAAGGIAGVLAAGILGPGGRGQGLRWGLPLLGSILGWQAVAAVAVITVAAARLTRSSPAASGLGLTTAATLVWVAAEPLWICLRGWSWLATT